MLVLGSLAWACLPYHGTVSVYPVNPGGQAVDQFAHGERAITVHGGVGQIDDDGEARRGMIWCDDSGGFTEGEPYQAGAIRPSMGSPDLMVVVEDRMSGCVDDPDRALPMGPYNVAINHAVYGAHANPDFDKNAISEKNDDRAGSCYFREGDDPADFDYVHPEPLMVHDDGGSLMIDNINMGSSMDARPFANVAGLCLRANDHNRTIIVPIEILDPMSGPPGLRHAGHGRGNGNGPPM